jgi:nucleotide-binding universal stress UspA family protein
MKNVLLVAAGAAQVSRAVAYALSRAQKSGGSLFAVVVLDPETTERVASTLANIGWVGEKVSEGVVDTLTKEQRAQAETLLQQIGEQAKKEGVAFTPMIEEGDPSEVCSRIIRQHQVGSAVLVAERRSWLTRFLSRSSVLKLPTLAGCEVKVMEEG